jgi:hypothetical protein
MARFCDCGLAYRLWPLVRKAPTLGLFHILAAAGKWPAVISGDAFAMKDGQAWLKSKVVESVRMESPLARLSGVGAG